ncbi:MAG: IS1634 family transposase [Acidobacteria bacterium]|nr:MAG: IS1634 family transposase [Acidobacteriota bacterium]
MFIDTVPNRNSPPAILLRESWREGRITRKRTLANLSHWPAHKVEQLRRVLRDEPLVGPETLFTVERSVPHGHIEAVLQMIRRLEVDTMIAARRSRERDLVVALLVERLIQPSSKLATTRLWKTTTLGDTLGVQDTDVDEVYAALDWLRARQPAIQQKLAARHLHDDGVALYDVSSSYYEGHTCRLARYGHDRDGHTGRPIIVYGVLTDGDGRPVAVDVYPGNTGDPTTVPDQVAHLQTEFGIARVVLIGDRGLVTETQLRNLQAHPGMGWISALRSRAIRDLIESGILQLSLFDQQRLAEITAPDYPGERLIACFNPLLAEERRRKREELLVATERALTKLAAAAARRTKTPFDDATLGIKVGRVINHYKMAKHVTVTIAKGRLQWTRNAAAIHEEMQLDGIYVIRTSEAADRLTAADAVRQYKNLAQVERAFRCLKGIDVRVRPIYHRTDDHVRAHIFLCMLAYYVEWHLRRAWAPLLFEDETLPRDRQTRDPVAPAQPSSAARQKKVLRQTADGLPVHSFDTLLADLGTRCEVTCRLRADSTSAPIRQWTPPTPLHARALELLNRVQDPDH